MTTHEDDEQTAAAAPPPVRASDPTPAQDPTPAPAPGPRYQTPDWEIPTNYPPQRRSFRNSLSFLNSAAVAESGTAKEDAPRTSTNDGVAVSATKPSLTAAAAAAARRRLDAILPPHKTYLGGRSRRFLLLCVVLPLALLLFVALPLAVGLGVGLTRRRHASSQAQSLPLPQDEGGSSSEVFTGELTYYDTGLGACGTVSSGGEMVCSISRVVFDAAAAAAAGDGGGSANPNANPLCGRRIRITRAAEGGGGRGNRSVDVTVVDRCVGCGPTDLDLSLGAFEQVALKESGRVVGSWAWLDD